MTINVHLFLEEKKNEEGLVVGYYVEYSVDNFSITDLKTEFEMSNNKNLFYK